MKIESVVHVVPEKILDNAEVIDRLRLANRNNLTAQEFTQVEASLTKLFAAANLRQRHVVDANEQPIDLVVNAAEQALAKANMAAKDLDFIIYGGVGRGFLVPSSASVVQRALGISQITCFDVLDACASWARAMQIANSFIAGGTMARGLVVNAECGFYQDYDVWSLREVRDIETEGGFFTIGEAATATIVGPAPDNKALEFHSYTFGEFGDLAILPIVTSSKYMRSERQISGPLRFYTQSQELTYNGFRLGAKLMRKIDPLKGATVDAFVPHAGAAPYIDNFMEISRIKTNHLIMSFADYGNTASASIPLGLSLGINDGRIRRGDKVFVSVVAAGISIVAVLFTY
ncbi:MAG: 3-oxoacyl-[acyl-carrier-protein] synthase III C-terminal domain-containing protein [Alphaproteobacteria bacterium]